MEQQQRAAPASQQGGPRPRAGLCLPSPRPPLLPNAQELKDDDGKRAMELAAYFTHCRLEPMHLALSLRSAMSIFFKHKNLATCAHFCRR